MRIILSPAKKMRQATDSLPSLTQPVFLKKAGELLRCLRHLSYEELKKLWACNEAIARQNFIRLQEMDLLSAWTPAIFSYDGIAFTYMHPEVFTREQFDYVQHHLRILSGFYGVLKAMDGVVPYRLEMQAQAAIGPHSNLYEFWGRRLYREVIDESRLIINLASREYSRCIIPYLHKKDRMVTCTFGELEKGKILQKGVYAKMARGDMVRYMAENRVEEPEAIKAYDRMGYRYCREHSSEGEFVFLRGEEIAAVHSA